MKNLLLILFFTKTILLTPDPVDLSNDWISIKPEKPLKAITGGAHIQLDVTKTPNILKDHKKLKEIFPKGTFKAKLIDSNKQEIDLTNRSIMFSNERVRIVLTSKKPIPTDKEFIEVLIKSNKDIKFVKIFWKNCRK